MTANASGAVISFTARSGRNKMQSKKNLISELKPGQAVDDIFVIKIKKGVSKYKNGFSFSLLLSDQSGSNIEYKYWGPDDEQKVNEIYNSMNFDSVVRVTGKVSEYMGKLQLISNDALSVLKVGEYDPGQFIMTPKRDVDEMYKRLIEAIASVGNKELKGFLGKVFDEIGEDFKKHPGAISIHHNWIGGLLQHTMEVLEYCLLSKKLFPELDRDLLIAGALLHDIGKLEEIEMTTRIKGTDRGQLIGHLPFSLMFIEKRMGSMDENLKNKLMHMIVSHHGKLEYGSPKEPMMPEALALYYADEMSAKIAEMTEFVKESAKHTEDNFMFNKRNGRNVLVR